MSTALEQASVLVVGAGIMGSGIAQVQGFTHDQDSTSAGASR